MRIATWNLDRPWKNGKTTRAHQQLAQIQSVGAVVWVLTETYSGFELPGCQSLSSPSSLGTYDASESAVAIWVPEAWALSLVSASMLHVCAEAIPPEGRPMLVYGTIIPWHGASGAPAWERHIAEAKRQAQEWVALATGQAWRGHSLVVCGDFNMTLLADDVGYGHTHGRLAVRQGFERAGLMCHTAVNIRLPIYGSHTRDNIDHIAVDRRLVVQAGPVFWNGQTSAGRVLSDHNGTAIDVMYK